MAIRSRKTTQCIVTFSNLFDTSDLTKKSPEKSLVAGLRKHGGRNAYGRITVRHRGGGAATKISHY